ncbi:MAG: NirD/YgiW/YdeI family stress tolerance protein [Rhodospirillales bacterium]
MRKTISIVGTAALLSLAALPVAAQANDAGQLAAAADRDWISVTGQVKSTSGNRFTLDYGAGDITVEMDEHAWYERNRSNFLPGDRVTVTGRIDGDLYQKRTIEASSVYLDKLNAYYYADPADEEGGFYSYPVARYAEDDEWLGITGTVLSRTDDGFTLASGPQTLSVDTGDVDRTLDVDVGDRVSVYGEMDDADLFESREILATSVVTLSQG